MPMLLTTFPRRLDLIVQVATVFLLLLSFTTTPICEARLEAAVLLPHGSEALEPSLLPPNTPARAAAEEISKAAYAAGRWLQETIQPDLIFLSTPHGITLSHNFGIYIGQRGSGTVRLTPEEAVRIEEKNDNSNNKTIIIRHLNPVDIAKNESLHIVHVLADRRHWNVEGIQTSPFDMNDVPLEYGSIIPLLMLQEKKNNAMGALITKQAAVARSITRHNLRRSLGLQAASEHQDSSRHQNRRRRREHIFFSHPDRRHTEATSDGMMNELLQLGRWWREWTDASPLRIAVIISGDLSHTHRVDGPYGYSDAAAPMDAALGRWASNPYRHADSLLVTARSLQPQALSCGFTGYVMLHGMLTGTCITNVTTSTTTTMHQQDFDAQVLVNRNATYFGMMVATFRRKEEA